MLGPQSCYAAIVLCLITFIHATHGYSPRIQSSACCRTYERSLLNKRRMLLFDGRQIRRNSPGSPTRLYGVLSRASILKHKSSSNRKNQKNSNSATNRKGLSSRNKMEPKSITRTFLMDAIEEAKFRQMTALECLGIEREKIKDELIEFKSIERQHSEKVDPCDELRNEEYADDHDDGREKEMTKNKRNPENALDRVAKRQIELTERIKDLEELRSELVNGGRKENSDNDSLNIATAEYRFRAIMASTGKPCSILDRPKDSWKIVAERSRCEFGRPKGFTGLVFYSPLGVPILIGKPNADSDGILRRASQGSDLWFQVEDYDGSRILLRSSLLPGSKDSKRCMQMAADLAAFYSVWGGSHRYNASESFDTVPVMYTDSKHVAKRGTKVGRMRKRKSLGRLMGRPSSVESIARGLEPS